MKVYLDDVRETPAGWVRCYWPSEVIRHLETREVTALSLDHDLGDDERGTGADVIAWLQERVMNEPGFPVPEIVIHSDNGPEVNLMRLGVESIHRLQERAVITISPRGVVEMLLGSTAKRVMAREKAGSRCGNVTSWERLRRFEAAVSKDDRGEVIRNVSIILGMSLGEAHQFIIAANKTSPLD